jgi:hypothetical protein
MRSALRLLPVALLWLAGCHKTPAGPVVDPYLPKSPPAAAVPAGLDPASWQTHLTADLLPYWTTAEAQGTPRGNFPTWRGMDGSVQETGHTRKPRMMGRQIFAYSAGFMLTGDEALLDLARDGTTWLLAHGQDTARGGWYADLDAAGAPSGDAAKFAQDMAYDAMGPAAFFFVTRDPAAEAAVLATRDLLFDPTRYWDAANGRIRDGMDGALAVEVSMNGNTASWELVAQLDPVTAFLLLVQPVLTEPTRQVQVLADLRTLAQRVHDSFWRDGIFWGATGTVGVYGSNHTDYGHILKSYWALLQVDKRLVDRPFHPFLAAHAGATLLQAYDAPNGRWAKKPVSASAVQYGSDWWAYAEGDQLAATLALHDPSWIEKVAATAPHFVADYVDRTRPVREVVSSVSQTGAWVYPWPDADTAKCNEWKNGFHSTEHALVMYLFGHWLAGTPAPLHFAFPKGQWAALAAAARPYTFLGTVDHVDDLGELAGDTTREHVVVHFKELR